MPRGENAISTCPIQTATSCRLPVRYNDPDGITLADEADGSFSRDASYGGSGIATRSCCPDRAYARGSAGGLACDDCRFPRERPLGDEDYGAECVRAVVYAGGLRRGARAADYREACREDGAGEEGLNEGGDNLWLHLFPGAAGAPAGGAPARRGALLPLPRVREGAVLRVPRDRGPIGRGVSRDGRGGDGLLSEAPALGVPHADDPRCAREREAVRRCLMGCPDFQVCGCVNAAERDSHRTRPFVRGGKWLTS